MNNIFFDTQGHLTAAAFSAMKNGILTQEELLELTEHLVVCEECAAAYAGSFTEEELLPAPTGFAESVFDRTKEERKSSKNNLQLFYYSLRVAVAVCAALILVFSGAFNSLIGSPQKMKPAAPSISFMDQISTGLRDFSQKVINIGGNTHASQKK